MVKILRTFIVAILAVAIIGAGWAVAANFQGTQGSGTTFASAVISAINYVQILLCDATVGTTQCAAVDASGNVAVKAAASTNIIGKVGVDQTTPGTTNGISIVGVNGSTALGGTGAVGAGAQRVAVGTDTATIAGSAPGTAGVPSTNVVSVQGVASGTTLPVTVGASASIIGKVGVDQTTPGTTNGISIVGVNGATALAGTGAVGTGAQRVAVGTDSATIAGSAPGTAGTPSANVVSIQGVAGGVTQPVTEANSAAILSAVQGAIPAGAALIGKVGIDQTTPGTTNGVSLNATPSLVNGNGIVQTQGGAVLSATNGAYTNVLQGNAVLSATNGLYANILQGNAAITTGNPQFVASVPLSTASGGMTTFFLQPAANDNHTNIKNGAGQVYWILAENNSATVNYLRFYNAATGFNGCASATNLITQIQIPASTSVGGVNLPMPFGIPFSTGISICVTTGYATTDTTAATATAISLTVGYN